jgi:hypothetical protein
VSAQFIHYLIFILMNPQSKFRAQMPGIKADQAVLHTSRSLHLNKSNLAYHGSEVQAKGALLLCLQSSEAQLKAQAD